MPAPGIRELPLLRPSSSSAPALLSAPTPLPVLAASRPADWSGARMRRVCIRSAKQHRESRPKIGRQLVAISGEKGLAHGGRPGVPYTPDRPLEQGESVPVPGRGTGRPAGPERITTRRPARRSRLTPARSRRRGKRPTTTFICPRRATAAESPGRDDSPRSLETPGRSPAIDTRDADGGRCVQPLPSDARSSHRRETW